MSKAFTTAHGDLRALPKGDPPPVNMRGVRILAWTAYTLLNVLYIMACLQRTAIPGAIFDDMHAGCHDLIRRNIAALVTSGQDILEMMNWDTDSSPQSVQMQLFPDLSEDEQLVYDFIQTGKKTIDEISEHCAGFSPSKLAGILLTMELRGVLSALPGKSYSVV